jgi:hypothetical protein
MLEGETSPLMGSLRNHGSVRLPGGLPCPRPHVHDHAQPRPAARAPGRPDASPGPRRPRCHSPATLPIPWMTARRSLSRSVPVCRISDTTGGNGVPCLSCSGSGLLPIASPSPAGTGRCPGWPKATRQGRRAMTAAGHGGQSPAGRRPPAPGPPGTPSRAHQRSPRTPTKAPTQAIHGPHPTADHPRMQQESLK